MTPEGVIERYWRKYTATLAGSKSVPNTYEAWHFGDSERLANELAELVRLGRKTATSFLAWKLETEGWKVPSPGDLTVVTDWDGNPSCNHRDDGSHDCPIRLDWRELRIRLWRRRQDPGMVAEGNVGVLFP